LLLLLFPPPLLRLIPQRLKCCTHIHVIRLRWL